LEKYNIKITGVFWLITEFEKYFSNTSEYKSIDLTLDRINSALKSVDFQESKLGKIIHIAGTNGKGTTAYILYQILKNNGYKVALYTSPHLNCITERIFYDGTQIKLNTFNELFKKYQHIISYYNLTYFEAITLLAFKYFESLHPDFSVIETGMGGKYDATNILDNKIPVITTISIDHEQYLGKTLKEIADEKIAIIKNNPLLFLGYNNSTILNYIKNYNKDLQIITPSQSLFEYVKSFYPTPYFRNVALALTISDYLNMNVNIENLKLPKCRFEKHKNFIFDGAHNFNGIAELLKNFKECFKKPTILYSCTKDRDVNKILSYILMKNFVVIATEMNNDRSIKIEDIKIENDNLFKIKDIKEAFSKAVEISKNNDILVCGSLYFCQEIKEIAKEV